MNRLIPLSRWLAALAAAGALVSVPVRAQPDTSPPAEFSQAEKLLLMSDQLGRIKPPATLQYTFRKTGSLEEAFQDRVDVKLKRQPDGKCCVATGDFLTGARHVNLPEVEQAKGNPVILYFLEHDIRNMQRLTKGSTTYFRKRIRMALFQGATVTDVKLAWRGKPVDGQEIVIRPYLDDPNRARFEQFARKQYVFVVSDAVPGGVVSIRSTAVADDKATTPLIDEELVLDGAESPRRQASL